MTTNPASSNVFYEVIPFDMLYTFVEKPQIMMTVGDNPAVCHNLLCDYMYVAPVGDVSSFTFDKASRKLTVQGSNLPIGSDLKKVIFAQTKCLIN
jgi:hypothetical protein